MLMFVVLIYCLIGVILSEDFYQKITKDEEINVFQTSTDKLPEYEIVPIYWPKLQTRKKGSTAEVTLTVFGEEITLELNPVDGVLAGYNTPVYMARNNTKDGGMRLDKYSSLLKDVHYSMMEDFQKGATIVVSQQAKLGKRLIGTVSSKNIAIKPIPERLIEDTIKQRKLIDRITYDDDYHYHVIHKTNDLMENKKSNILQLKTSYNGSKPDIVYPEILVVVDHTLYQKLGGNVWNAIPYLLALWNGIDMRYRILNNPKWRLNIAGIVIAEDPVLTYLENNKRTGPRIEAALALKQSGSFWYLQNKTISVESYDLIATMTTQDLCYDNEAKDDCEAGILGVAYIGSVCHVDHPYQDMSKVALIQDDGLYSAIFVGAHELGHAFGSMHDSNDICKITDGYIMAGSPIMNNNSYYWSTCSVKQISSFINTNPTCIFNKPNTDMNLPKLMAGKYRDVNEQCMKSHLESKACDIDHTTCQQLKCINKSNNLCEISNVMPEDGTKCGDNKFCMFGQCIDEI
ncbi:venom metalloproteinase 3-like [Aphidius gifuensis]|uniref:venom metalloproteinase 3-like n=1 Tax=Aphidius gifuensis TaxID=684658 RepID=UPI001CDC6364|nr:venom metalloproteinase 3-like [Aphidius gifuensis]